MNPFINTYSRLKYIILFLAFPLFSDILFGQQKGAADGLVKEGIDLQDKGQVDSALSRYNQALELDRDNLRALCEMAYSFLSIEKYDQAIDYSKRAIRTHPYDPVLKAAYVSYGNALDAQGKTDKSIDIYNEGIKQFPEYFQLYYNKGISQNRLGQADKALLSFQKSAMLNPNHASTHNAIGLLLFNQTKIASLLALCRFLALESNTNRSSKNLNNIRDIMGAHVTKKDSENITISVSPDMLEVDKNKQKENFSSAELLLSLNSALDYDSINVNKTGVEKFIRKFTTLCGYLQETKNDHDGFYWNYYVPYFSEMNDKKLITTFAYIAFTSSKDIDVTFWLDAHKTEVAEFYKWSGEFKWNVQ